MAVSTHIHHNKNEINIKNDLTIGSENISYSTKVFCDPVHGQITLHPVCVAFIDTPQFQRLRLIKQNGFTEFVYPGATNNRFGHSLGVSYLAGKFIRNLKRCQPELKISSTDILCVELAGLCQDLGHGPFSHTWEKYINISNQRKKIDVKWKHETVSTNIFDHIIESNNLNPILKDHGIGAVELQLIKNLIHGDQPSNPERYFLYQIVNNEDSGVNVHKWDYFMRDCLYLGLPWRFKYERFMEFTKVIKFDGKMQICFKEKVFDSVYKVFHALHKMAYKHKVTISLEKKFIDALLLAEGEIIGLNGEVLQYWQWSMVAFWNKGNNNEDLQKFCMLTDNLVYSCLKYTSSPSLQNVSALIRSIESHSYENRGKNQNIDFKVLPCFWNENEILEYINKFLPEANEQIANSSSNSFDDENFSLVSKDELHVLNESLQNYENVIEPASEKKTKVLSPYPIKRNIRAEEIDPAKNELQALKKLKMDSKEENIQSIKKNKRSVKKKKKKLQKSCAPSHPIVLRPIVIDASNIARDHGRKERVFSCKGIKIAVDFFKSRGHQSVLALLPRWRRFATSDEIPTVDAEILDKLEQSGNVVYTPSRRIGKKRITPYDDRFIVNLATSNEGVILSNDNYNDLVKESTAFKKTIEERLLLFCFAGDYFMVPDDPLGRNGPSLDEFLSVPAQQTV